VASINAHLGSGISSTYPTSRLTGANGVATTVQRLSPPPPTPSPTPAKLCKILVWTP
jgi:hypothetical protein